MNLKFWSEKLKVLSSNLMRWRRMKDTQFGDWNKSSAVDIMS